MYQRAPDSERLLLTLFLAPDFIPKLDDSANCRSVTPFDYLFDRTSSQHLIKYFIQHFEIPECLYFPNSI